MAKISAKLREKENSVLGIIDAIKDLTEELSKSSVGDISNTSNINMQLNSDPMSLLLTILQRFVGYDEVIDWLSKYIVYEVPVIELAIKGILLSNLKKTIDCTNDPRIPEKYRAYLNDSLYSETQENEISSRERGFFIDLNGLDLNGMLQYSPFSKEGRTKYFGTQVSYTVPKVSTKKGESSIDFEKLDTVYSYSDALEACKIGGLDESFIQKYSEVDTVYELARANDFNAFLWFVKNSCKFPLPEVVDVSEKYTSEVLGGYDCKTSLEPFTVSQTVNALEDKRKKYKVGMCYYDAIYSGDTINHVGSLVGLCIKNKEIYQGDTFSNDKMSTYTCESSFVPFSMDNMSANWYVNRKRYYDFLYDSYTKDKTIKRNYDEEFAICNLSMNRDSLIVNGVKMLNLQILPKPAKIRPTNNEEGIEFRATNPLIFTKRLTFDKQGRSTVSGNYTLKLNNETFFTVIEKIEDNTESIKKKVVKLYYYILDANEKASDKYFLEIDRKGKYRLVELESVSKDKNKIVEITVKPLSNTNELSCFLFECYKGMTIYEFNYDLVMGMRLFDAKTLTANLVNAFLSGLGSGTNIGLGLNKSEIAYQARISAIIEKMMTENTSEVSDCFFNFSNDEFNRQLEESELKRSQLYPFNDNVSKATKVSVDDIYNTLNEYSDSNDKETNVDVISRVLKQVTTSITDEVMPSDKYSLQFNASIDLIKMLALVIVEALLTPKVLLLFQINKELMGDIREKNSVEDILRVFLSVILAVVRELVEMILQYLLEWVLSILLEIFELLAKYLIVEQAKYYKNLIATLIKNRTPKFRKNRNLQTVLDKVYYADIDQSNEIKKDEC